MKKKIVISITFVVGLYYFLEFLLPPFVGGGFDCLRMGSPCLIETQSSQGYRLYYTGIRSLKKSSDQRLGIGLAMSGDGAAWTKYDGNPLLARSLFSSKDWRGPDHPAVVREPDGSYTMFLVGHSADGIDRVMRATSADGLSWHGREVVLSLVREAADISRQLERASITALAVRRTDAGYVAYFAGTYRREGKTIQGVSRATSTDGRNWSLDAKNNPVLPIEAENGWEYSTITDLSVLEVDGELRLYYAGTKTYFLSGGETVLPMTLIGLATSPDGVAWTRDAANPIFGPALWRFLKALRSQPHVAAARRRLNAVDSSLPRIKRIGPTAAGVIDLVRALSSDAAWTSAMAAAVRPLETDEPEAPFDTLVISGISVARAGNGYVMAYAGTAAAGADDYRIGLTTSNDGIVWTPGDGEPVLELGDTPASTYLWSASVTVSRVFIVVGAMALGLGVFGLAKLHGGRVAKREKDWVYSLGFFIALVFTLVVAFLWGKENPEKVTAGTKLYDVIYKGLLVSFGASSMGLLTFYLASASYRSFKLKNAEAALMMIAAVLVMLGQVPLGQLLTSWLPDSLAFLQIQNVTLRMSYAIVIPAMRAIQIGAAVGGLVLATRLWLSMDKRRR